MDQQPTEDRPRVIGLVSPTPSRELDPTRDREHEDYGFWMSPPDFPMPGDAA